MDYAKIFEQEERKVSAVIVEKQKCVDMATEELRCLKNQNKEIIRENAFNRAIKTRIGEITKRKDFPGQFDRSDDPPSYEQIWNRYDDGLDPGLHKNREQRIASRDIIVKYLEKEKTINLARPHLVSEGCYNCLPYYELEIILKIVFTLDGEGISFKSTSEYCSHEKEILEILKDLEFLIVSKEYTANAHHKKNMQGRVKVE